MYTVKTDMKYWFPNDHYLIKINAPVSIVTTHDRMNCLVRLLAYNKSMTVVDVYKLYWLS